jgi:tetratricopeptide (TPR) repeat protein
MTHGVREPGGPDGVPAFLRELRRLKIQAGDPPLRALQRSTGIPRSTLSDALDAQRRTLPRLEVVLELVRAFGLPPAEVARWERAWQTVRTREDGSADADGPGDAGGVAPAPAGAKPASPPPRQLPPAIRHFTGRDRHLKTLRELVPDAEAAGGAAAVCVLTGTGGTGKTALAVQFAHLVADRFPDGQLFVDLRGFDPTGTPTAPGTAVRALLTALGVRSTDIPADVEEQTALYRSRLAGTRTLVVLDNALDSAQVRPLLPGSGGCLVLVTSRGPLAGLVAMDGAARVAVDPLETDEARDLLVRRLGRERLAAVGDDDAGPADSLVELCAGLPLALNLACARALAFPAQPLSALVAELRDSRRRLDVLSTGEPDSNVRAVFSWSYRTLDAPAAAMFRLLGVPPGADLGEPAAASLTGLPRAAARRALDDLVAAGLTTEPMPGRAALHDLLRRYAADLVDAEDGPRAWHEAFERLLNHYLLTLSRSASAVSTRWLAFESPEPLPGVVPEAGVDWRAWCDVECAAVVAAVELAASTGFPTYAWQIAGRLMPYLRSMRLWREWTVTTETALAAATAAGSTVGAAHAHRWLGELHRELGRFDDAQADFENSRTLFADEGDQGREGLILLEIGRTQELQGGIAEALAASRRALLLFEAAGDPSGQAQALNNIGYYSGTLGDLDDALIHLSQALELARDHGSRHLQAAVHDSIGFLHHKLGDQQQAVEHYQAALAIVEAEHLVARQAEVLFHLADAYREAGDAVSEDAARRRARAIVSETAPP